MRLVSTPMPETPRLILRRFAESDIEDIFHISSDREVNRFLPWFPLRSLDEARKFLFGDIFSECAEESAYRYAIESRSDRRVGRLCLSLRDESAVALRQSGLRPVRVILGPGRYDQGRRGGVTAAAGERL